MPTMRQQQGEIGRWLAERGFEIHDHGDTSYHLVRVEGECGGRVPHDVWEQFERWAALEDQRWERRRGVTPGEIELLDQRIMEKGFQRLDEEQREALLEDGWQADALLDDLQARVGVFTDDFSAALSGEDPALAFDAGEHLKYGLSSESLPWSLDGAALSVEQEEADAHRPRP